MSATEDPVFVAFRRKLADVVTVAINSGKPVGQTNQDPDCCCPLGSHPDAEADYPFASHAANLFAIDSDDAFAFIRGYSQAVRDDHYKAVDRGPYYDLGRLYRARFP